MIVCFICKNKYISFGAFKSHLTLCHHYSEFKVLICAEENCGRKFQLFNSFRRHLLTHTDDTTSTCSISPDVQVYSNDNVFCPPLLDLVADVESLVEPNNENVVIPDAPETTFESAIATLIAKLYSNQNLPRNVVDLFIDGLKHCLSESLILEIKRTLEKLSDSNEIPSSCINTVMKSVAPVITLPLEKFCTEYKRLQYFELQSTFIRPQQIVIGQRLDTVRQDGVSRLIPVTCEQSFISLRHVLKKFFSLKGLLIETLNFMTSLKNNSYSCNGAIENYIQGSYWKSRIQSHGEKIVMPLFLYFDDYETGNALGSRAGQHKLGAVYVLLPCLPPCRTSSLNNIFLFLLFHSSDRVMFGNQIIFRCVIDELNYLNDNGIDLDVPGFKGKVYFELGLILGDNLGIHSICGFVESFSANFSCRVCKTRKEIMKYQCEEDTSLLRNACNYESDLLADNLTETGIKERCIWLDVKNFSIFDQIGVDWMHDVLEGVAKYIMSIIIKKYTREQNIFTLEVLNQRIEAFSYGPDNRNKPCSLSTEHIIQGNIRLSSSEMLTLIRYFSLLVGEFVPKKSEFWNLYIKLRIIIDILSTTAFAKGTGEFLQAHVTDLNTLYLSLCNDTLKPKFHNLIHYHTALEKFGPLIFIWSMRFEAKHRISKIAAKASSNRRNITLSLAIKQQLKLNDIFLKGQLDDIIKTGPEIECDCLESQYIADNLRFPLSQKIVKISWATISSTYYTKDTVLVYSNLEDDLVTFFKLTDMFTFFSKSDLIFRGILLHTLNFDEHFYAFEVLEPQVNTYVVKLYSLLVSPIPCNISIVSNKKYVTLRSPI